MKPNNKKRPAASKKKTAPHKTPLSDITLEQQIIGAVFLGKIIDVYDRLEIIMLLLEAPLSVGETIRIKGHATDLTQKVEILQIAHENVPSALAGETVGIKIAAKARPGDAVYKC